MQGGAFYNSNGKYYVAQYNGTAWSELGGLNGLAANGCIFSICGDVLGNIYTAGQMTNSSGKYYVAKYNGTTWSELGGLNGLAGSGPIYSIYCDFSNNIYTGGQLFDLNNYVYVAEYGNATGIKTTCCTTSSLSLQPNPTATSTTLTFNNELSNATVEVMNVTGQIVVKKENVAGKQIPIDLSKQAAGLYFITVHQNTEVWRGKVVKE